jgi:hypothetical protein
MFYRGFLVGVVTTLLIGLVLDIGLRYVWSQYVLSMQF